MKKKYYAALLAVVVYIAGYNGFKFKKTDASLSDLQWLT